MAIEDKYLKELESQREGGLKGLWNRITGKQFSQNDLAQSQFQINRQEAEWQHSEDMYNQYESPAAMMRQYQEAGLNTALMYGGSSSPNPVDTSSGSSPSLESSGAPDILGQIFSMLSGASQIADIGSQIKSRSVDNNVKQQNAETERYNAETNRMNAENETRKTDAFIQTSEVERQLKRSEIHLNEKQTEVMEAQIVDYNSKVDARTQEVALKWYLANLEEDKFEFSKFKYNDTERPKSMAEIANLEAQAALSSAYEELAKTEAWAKANEVERENRSPGQKVG